MFASKKLFGRSPSAHSRRNHRRLGRLESLEDRRMFNVDPHGGPVIPSVAVEPIYLGSQWGSDPGLSSDAHQINQFLSYLTGTSYMDLLAQYSKPGMTIGHGSELASKTLNVALPPGTIVSDADIQQSLNSWIDNGSVGRPYANELFFFFAPPDVVVTTENGGNSLVSFYGYHSSFTDEYGDHVPYAVIPNPVGNLEIGGLSTFQQQTEVSSHELAEAVTDPDSNGWYDSTKGLSKGEVGDLANLQVVYLDNYAVQREWSNEAGGAAAPAGATDAPVQPLQVTGGVALNETQGLAFNAEVGTFDDPNSGASPGAYTIQINWGDGLASTGTAVAEGNGQFKVLGTHTFQAAGDFTVDFTVGRQDDALSGAATSTAAVTSPPAVQVNMTGGYPINLAPGDHTVNQALVTFVDPSGNGPVAAYQATINWGDNQSSPGAISFDSGSGQFVVSGDHTYAGPGAYTISVIVSHGNGATNGEQTQITISDPPPPVTQPVNITGGYPINLAPGDYTVNQPLVTFVDPSGNGVVGDYQAAINWGDNQSSPGSISFDTGSGQFVVSGDHTYASAGNYQITVVVSHGNGPTNGEQTDISLTPPQSPVVAPPVVTPPVVTPPVVTPPVANPPVTPPSLTPNEHYVIAVYRALFGSDPLPSELASWAGQLDGGLSRYAFVNSLDHSANYFATIIEPAYQQYLGRAADGAGLAFWTNAMRNGLTDEQLEADFIGSAEFYQNSGGTDVAWVDSLYQHLLGRAADAQGEAWWTAALAAGESRSQVALGFTQSSERETQRIQDDYFNYLGRGAGDSEVAYWLNQFEHGQTNEDLITGFLGSNEYYGQHTS